MAAWAVASLKSVARIKKMVEVSLTLDFETRDGLSTKISSSAPDNDTKISCGLEFRRKMRHLSEKNGDLFEIARKGAHLAVRVKYTERKRFLLRDLTASLQCV